MVPYLINKLNENAMGCAYSTHGRDEECIQNFSWRPEEKRLLGRPICIWEDNRSLKSRIEGVDWTQLAHNTPVY